MKVDFRLVILLLLAVAFLFSSMRQHDVQTMVVPVVIEGDFIDFDYEEIFNLPAEGACLEESSLPSRSQVL